MRWARVIRAACAVLLLLAMASETLAAVAPGTVLRVHAPGVRGRGADRFEGRLVGSAPSLAIVTLVSGDTLHFEYSEIERVETPSVRAPGRSVVGTTVGALLIGGLTFVGLFGTALSDETGFVANNAWLTLGAGSVGAAVFGGWLIGRPSADAGWVDVPIRSLRDA